MLLMRAFSSADTSAVDCLSEMLSSACTTSGRECRSVVLAHSQLMPCVGDADPADASENGRERGTSRCSSNVTASSSNSNGVGGGKRRSLMASTWFPRGRGSLLLGHVGGQGFPGGCAVVEVTLSSCSYSNNPKAKAPSCTAVVSLSFPDNSVRSARRTLHGGEVVLRKEARE